MNLASAYRIPDLDEMEAMRPRKGDIVAHGEDEELFIVEEVGMKFFVCRSLSNPKAQRWFKHFEVFKWTPPDDLTSSRKPIDLTQTFSHLGPRD